MEKVLVSIPKKFESKIFTFKESQNLNKIALSELIIVLQAMNQMRQIRKKESIKGGFVADQRKGDPYSFQEKECPSQKEDKEESLDLTFIARENVIRPTFVV